MCHNNSGRNTFEFEDLTKLRSAFSYVNVLYCRRSYSHFQDDFGLFVLTGSVLVFEKAAVFFSRPNYIVTNGDLMFYDVAIDLEGGPPCVARRVPLNQVPLRASEAEDRQDEKEVRPPRMQ
jgi:hypothetical protein